MINFVLRIIVIEYYYVGGFPLEQVSEHCFLSIKVLFWCWGFIYCVVLLLFSTIFLFSTIIIDLVPYRQRDGKHEKNQEENVTGDVLQDAFVLYVDNISESWVVDSRASFHATTHRKHFIDYVQGDFG